MTARKARHYHTHTAHRQRVARCGITEDMDRVRPCDGHMTRDLALVTCGRCLKKLAATADRVDRRAAGEQVPVNGCGWGVRERTRRGLLPVVKGPTGPQEV